jgi:acetoin utilization deacetylase AcuC-like enzyme
MLRIFSDKRCLLHEVPFGFPEVSERLRRVLEELRAAGLAPPVAASHPGAEAAIATTHDPGYVARFRRAVRRGDGLICSSDNPLSDGTWQAAQAAVEAILEAGDWMVAGADRTAFVATRPPGHHAEHDTAMGFCYFNNVAVLADYLLREHGLERVAIFDFDVHHGNGTQHLFEERPDVLYASTHQYPFYPGTGAAAESGRGAGAGATVNVPLPAGTGDQGYGQAISERILPALREFAPQALLVSAGFDAWELDPLGGMRVSEAEFGRWGRVLGELAAEVCEGRTLAVLEGGYDLEALGRLAARFISELSGSPAG